MIMYHNNKIVRTLLLLVLTLLPVFSSGQAPSSEINKLVCIKTDGYKQQNHYSPKKICGIFFEDSIKINKLWADLDWHTTKIPGTLFQLALPKDVLITRGTTYPTTDIHLSSDLSKEDRPERKFALFFDVPCSLFVGCSVFIPIKATEDFEKVEVQKTFINLEEEIGIVHKKVTSEFGENTRHFFSLVREKESVQVQLFPDNPSEETVNLAWQLITSIRKQASIKLKPENIQEVKLQDETNRILPKDKWEIAENTLLPFTFTFVIEGKLEKFNPIQDYDLPINIGADKKLVSIHRVQLQNSRYAAPLQQEKALITIFSFQKSNSSHISRDICIGAKTEQVKEINKELTIRKIGSSPGCPATRYLIYSTDLISLVYLDYNLVPGKTLDDIFMNVKTNPNYEAPSQGIYLLENIKLFLISVFGGIKSTMANVMQWAIKILF